MSGTDPRTFPQLVAALNPSTLPTITPGALGSPAMLPERVPFMALTDSGGEVANIVPLAGLIDGIDQPSLATVAFNYGFNGLNWDRLRAAGDAADAVATAALGRLITLARGSAFNGATWDRLRSASAANQAAANPVGVLQVAAVGNFGIQNTPAAATQATISRGAGGVGIRHIATAVTVGIAAVAAQGPLIFNLRDGASGVGAILWSATLIAPVGQGQVVTLSGLSIPGTANTALTLESAAAPAATNFAFVSLSGYSVA